MSKKKKKKRLLDSLFYRVYFAALAVALVCVVIGLIWLNGVVSDYEVSQPVHAAEVVAQLFENSDFARLYAFDTSAQEISGGDEAFYVQSLSDLARGRTVAWREAFSPNADSKNYSVTLDGEKFATFTLVPSGRTTGHGNRLWQLGSVTTHVTLEQPQPEPTPVPEDAAVCRVTVPEGSVVTVDGRTLTQADAVASEPLFEDGFLPEGCASPVMTRYAFVAQSDAPAISVTDAAGEALTVESADEGEWRCGPKEDAALRETYSEDIVKLAGRIAKYTAKDLSQSSLLAGVASDSPAETVIKKFSNSWAPVHKTSQIVDPVVSEFCVISDECFTCHVTFDFVLTSRKGNDYVYPTAYTFCVVKRRGEGRLYNLMFH